MASSDSISLPALDADAAGPRPCRVRADSQRRALARSISARHPGRSAGPPLWLMVGAPVALLAFGLGQLGGDLPLERRAQSRGQTTAPIRASGVAPVDSN